MMMERKKDKHRNKETRKQRKAERKKVKNNMRKIEIESPTDRHKITLQKIVSA